MTSQPMEATQQLQRMRSRITALPPQTVVAATPGGAAGPVGEALAASRALLETINGATERRANTAIDLEEKKAELEVMELEAKREDLEDDRRERREERQQRRSGGNMAEMFQVMQAMMQTYAGGSSSEVAALRAELAEMQRQANDERTQSLIANAQRQTEMLAQEIRELRDRTAIESLPERELERVRSIQEQMRAFQDLFGVSPSATADANTDVTTMLARHRLRIEEEKAEDEREERRMERERTHQRFMAELESVRRRDDQTEGLLEGIAPVLDQLAGKYLGAGAEGAPSNVTPLPSAQPQYAPPPAPVQLPEGVVIATCPACAGQAPIPAGFGAMHGCCVNCGMVVTVDEGELERLLAGAAAPGEPDVPTPRMPVSITDYQPTATFAGI